MVVLSSLRRALRGLARNPALFVAAGLVALLQVPSLVSGSLGPIGEALLTLGFALVYLLVYPFLQGGLVAMADEAIAGRTRFGTFFEAGRGHYVSLLGAQLLLLAVTIATGFSVLLALLVVGVPLVEAGAPMLAGSERTGALALVLSVGLLAYFLVFLFVQFYAQAVVLEGQRAVEGFSQSVGVVRANLVSAVGFSVLFWAVSLLLGGVGFLASSLLSPSSTVGFLDLPTPTAAESVGLAVVVLASHLVATAVLYPYAVSFYRAAATGQ